MRYILNKLTFGFIGLGLIGGSIAKAIKLNISDSIIMAYDINNSSLELAYNEKVIDVIEKDITIEFSKCNYIFL